MEGINRWIMSIVTIENKWQQIKFRDKQAKSRVISTRIMSYGLLIQKNADKDH